MRLSFSIILNYSRTFTWLSQVLLPSKSYSPKTSIACHNFEQKHWYTCSMGESNSSAMLQRKEDILNRCKLVIGGVWKDVDLHHFNIETVR